MRKVSFYKMFLSIAISLLFVPNVDAAIINSDTCSLSDVQAALDASISGDTIVVPPGNCTWNGVLSVSNSKKIWLLGAGMDSTIITGDPTDRTLFKLNRSGSRLSGFGVLYGRVEADGYNFRVDHCRITLSTWSNGISVMSRNINPAVIATGLIDNCDFHNMRILVNGTNYMLTENGAQHGLWASPLNLGSAEAVYIENNTFTGGINAVDGNYGGRYVFRHNTLNDVYIESHSVQATNRAIRKWEVYNNTINQAGKAMWVPGFIRGGTGVIFNNTITGTWSLPKFAFDNVRSCDAKGEGGLCDGASLWDGNTPGEAGYPCRDQIGRSTDQSLWTEVALYPPQELAPVYVWNNKHGVNEVDVHRHNCAESQAHIQANRDYYVYEASFDGSIGVGVGAFSNRPATCTEGVAYWATDDGGDWNKTNGSANDGCLYKCTDTNTWTKYYTPYTYPHPLREQPLKPQPPQNLKISN